MGGPGPRIPGSSRPSNFVFRDSGTLPTPNSRCGLVYPRAYLWYHNQHLFCIFLMGRLLGRLVGQNPSILVRSINCSFRTMFFPYGNPPFFLPGDPVFGVRPDPVFLRYSKVFGTRFDPVFLRYSKGFLRNFLTVFRVQN